ncbi:phage portal protein [Aquitalea magnusonii]|uniref:SPP1 Gp6-like portal protein n=1 Tax=Aquitalea magnusonii TaxID=332411 RepID=A0A318J772_9NEIS|nr:phage portal protein [Aquitalea magnusonii]PXX42225.1 SPP1 Gp6-like portal protein [Aquitalea magnusonii]
MDFQELRGTYPKDSDYPERTRTLLALTKVLDGTMYDCLQYPFDKEQVDVIDEYIPLSKRRPSVRYNLCRTVVEDSVSLLFSEGHFPAFECADEATRDSLERLSKDSGLNLIMTDAAIRGSVGSVAILMRVLKKRIFWKVLPTAYLTPEWQPDAPDTLQRVTEQYKVKGADLKAMGYAIADDDASVDFWFCRIWDANAETWHDPLKVDDAKKGQKFTVDAKRTTQHNLGFVPMVWVKNLPGGDDIDGMPTMPSEAIDCQIEIDYQLSQAGRGLRYSSDPTLHIKQPAFGEGQMVRGADRAIITSTEGDAKLLEINGTAVAAVVEYVRAVRELALETAHGNRANADKLSAAQSGRAMELMNQALIWLADKLRTSYGEGALLDLLSMAVRASAKFKLVDKRGSEIGPLSEKGDISLRWPAWYAPTYADKQTQAETVTTLRDGGLLSRETAVKSIADSYDIADPADELRQIDKDPPSPNSAAAAPKQEPLSQSDD